MFDILVALEGKWGDGTRPKDLYTQHVLGSPTEYLPVILEGLSSDAKRVQNGCAEITSLLSIDRPELLLPHMDLFVANLCSKAPIQRWEAVHIIGNLAAVDSEGRIPALVDHITPYLEDKSIVLAGYAVQTLAKVAEAYPGLAEGILDTLIEKSVLFKGNRVGFIVENLERLIGYPELHPKIRAFAEPFTVSDVNVVKRKARRLMKKL
ncbi:hypothetical protein JXL21_02415 [Candidatus Bathyarchaeota archaeon]|nr:hypothetical protein [Candidatus Bathyarchaeota archaeon]